MVGKGSWLAAEIVRMIFHSQTTLQVAPVWQLADGVVNREALKS
jgi:hypothetical protein